MTPIGSHWTLKAVRLSKLLVMQRQQQLTKLGMLSWKLEILLESATFQNLKAFKLQLESKLDYNVFQKLLFTFPELTVDSLKVLQREMAEIAGLRPQLYDCCRNSCI